jgi:hypothetical protein
VFIHDHDDGRIEATGLHNASGVRGTGLSLLREAVQSYGANYVECFGAGLSSMYATLGFRNEATYPFDPAQAPADWNTERDDSPEHRTMRLP